MVRVGKWIARHRILILVIAVALLIPSAFGYLKTRTNYDLLTYLPESLETVKGQDILIDEYGMGAFSMVVVDNKSLKDDAKVEKDIEAIPHVKDVLWYDDVADLSLPVEFVPDDLREKFINGDATMMLVLLDNSSSDDATMTAVRQIRSTLDKDCYVSGATAILNDLSDLTDEELPVYIGIAVACSLAAMILLTDSFLVPFLFLIDIAFAVVYNMGTNFMFGSISYITKAVAAVLQLGVTMDYSIFLLGSYRENKQRFPGQNERAMGHAIANTFRSIIGSSVTTIAGFIALCFMSFTLGLDMGLVMAKGVFLGVITCVTVLPALVLFFDKAITKTAHRPLIRSARRQSDFITKHYKVWIVIFLVMLIPAIYGNNNVGVYYDMMGSLPESLPSMIAQDKVEEEFGANNLYMILMDKDVSSEDKRQMIDQIEDVDGVSWCLGLNSIVDPSVPDSMIPSDVRDMMQSDNYELIFVSTAWHAGSDEINAQIDEVSSIVKGIDKKAMVVGEAPLTHDLVSVTNTDFRNVNAASLIIIFIIIALVFKSLSLPIILELTIEFAIWCNMAYPFFTGQKIPFVTSIILGTVQLGSTVDYAILMTTRYQKERQRGKDKFGAVKTSHEANMPSIITSGISFFAATFGVSLYSDIDIIQSVCSMLARGALISTVVVLFVLPGMLIIFDPLIVKTSWRFLDENARFFHSRKNKIDKNPAPQPAPAVAVNTKGSLENEQKQTNEN